MTREHCRELLAATRISRLAFVMDGRPRLVVLNHVVDGDRVVFQTSEDTALARLTADGTEIPVTLEVDSAASSNHSGWSVVASGPLRRVSAAEVGRFPTPWRPEAVGVLLALTVQEIHGLAVGG